MDKTLSPRQVAKSIGASESSVKRWCDRGLVPFNRTGGGHRRIPLAGVLEFVRREKMSIVAPESIGLPENVGRANVSFENASSQLKTLLVAGDEDRCRVLIWDLHIAGHSISEICDGVVAGAFQHIGTGWCDGNVEIYQERRSCEITWSIMAELRRATYLPSESSPKAMGGTSSGDPYALCSKMVELVLRENGWNASSIGAEVPFSSLCHAITTERPRLFWLCVSFIKDEAEFVTGFNQLQEVAGQQTAIVVGGRALTDDVRHRLNYTVYCDKLEHLARFASTIYKPEVTSAASDASDASDTSTVSAPPASNESATGELTSGEQSSASDGIDDSGSATET